VASLAGILGLVLLAFGFGATALVGLGDPFVLFNLVLGAAGIVTSLALGFQDFQTLLGQRSTRYGAGAAIYSVLFVALLAGANYLSWRHHHRWDVTEAGVYTLAPQSKSIVAALKQDLRMTAFVEGGQDPQLDSLLESYRYAAPERVTFQLVDPDKRPELVDQMKVTALRSVALQYGPESFVVTNPTEETITNGIIRVARTAKKTIYFVEGHGEADVANQQEPSGYAAAKLALEQENYEVKTLVLPSAQSMPADASAIVIPGPDRALTDHELTMLDAYLKNGGHLLAMVGPRQGDERLTKLLADWGVKLGANIVIDQEMRLFEGPSMGIQPITKTYGTHPITQNFRDYTTWPQTRTVAADAAGRKGFSATELVKTSPTSRALGNVEELFAKGTATVGDDDPKGPLAIGVAVEAKLADLGIQASAPPEGKAPTEARLVVFGTEQFADNQRLSQSRLNADIFLNSVGWLVGQEELVSVRSRSVRASRAELTPTDSLRVFYLSVLVVPELMVLAGIAVWWRRKSR
jgi:ABC-type uncharacterized transport system involved in gliding motility auxiliary subunit